VTYKEQIEDIPNALSIVEKMRGVSFKWKDNKKKSIGIIAQEMEIIVPEIVNTKNDGKKSVVYDSIIPFLIEAIKELRKEILELKGKK
jgi:hypothetical protein